MTYFIITILIGSIFCNGIYTIMDQGMILHPLLKWMEKRLVTKRGDVVEYHFLYKPLGGCLTCMASIWGSIVYWSMYSFGWPSLALWPIAIVCMAFMNNVVYSWNK